MSDTSERATTNIINRLRSPYIGNGPDYREQAADLIAALAEENKQLKQHIETLEHQRASLRSLLDFYQKPG